MNSSRWKTDNFDTSCVHTAESSDKVGDGAVLVCTPFGATKRDTRARDHGLIMVVEAEYLAAVSMADTNLHEL